MPTTKYRYDSLTEMLEDSRERWDDSLYASGGRHSSAMEEGRNKWNGGTYESATKKLTTGWTEGAVRVAKVRAELNDSVEQIVAENKDAIHFDTEGTWADIGRLATGEPECCGFFDQGGSSKVVKIIANICVSASVSTETMFARGAATCAAVDILEALGYRVELVVAIGMAGYDAERKDVQAVLKSADQPVDSDRIAYALCHPSFFRRLMFMVMESVEMDPCGCRPYSVTADEEGSVVLPELCSGRTPSTEDTIQEVIKICQACGIDLSSETVEA